MSESPALGESQQLWPGEGSWNHKQKGWVSVWNVGPIQTA